MLIGFRCPTDKGLAIDVRNPLAALSLLVATLTQHVDEDSAIYPYPHFTHVRQCFGPMFARAGELGADAEAATAHSLPPRDARSHDERRRDRGSRLFAICRSIRTTSENEFSGEPSGPFAPEEGTCRLRRDGDYGVAHERRMHAVERA